jgi:hypothetical protein
MISCFEYDKEEWYRRYVLGQQTPPSKEMEFGNRFAKSIENGTCDYPGLLDALQPKKEQKFEVQLGKLRLKGFADAFDEVSFTVLDEVKTGKKPWDQKRVDAHDQITMYALMNLITNKVRPEDMTCSLYWCPTEERGDFSIQFVEPRAFKKFTTKRTTAQVLKFATYIQDIHREMQAYALAHA